MKYMIKTDENQPLELYKRHEETLNLKNPLIVDNENVLFETHAKLHESAVVYLPKSKPLIDMTLALISNMVKKDGVIVLVGEKMGGIESAKKIYEKNIGTVEQKLVGNHSALYVGKNQRLSADKKIKDFFSVFTISYKGKEIKIASLPGVFSAGELDKGTKHLLDNMHLGKAKVLDMACGAGVVGVVYKILSPESEIDFCDASAIAVETTKETLRINNIEAEVFLSDIFSEVVPEYDLILVNPPFHKGIGTDYTFIEKFTEEAMSHLGPKGEVNLVANSFLKYMEKIQKIGPAKELYRDNEFVVYSARNMRTV